MVSRLVVQSTRGPHSYTQTHTMLIDCAGGRGERDEPHSTNVIVYYIVHTQGKKQRYSLYPPSGAIAVFSLILILLFLPLLMRVPRETFLFLTYHHPNRERAVSQFLS